MTICSICLRTGHTASSCRSRVRDGSSAQSFAAGMKAAREAQDTKPSDDFDKTWERLQEAMRGGL